MVDHDEIRRQQESLWQTQLKHPDIDIMGKMGGWLAGPPSPDPPAGPVWQWGPEDMHKRFLIIYPDGTDSTGSIHEYVSLLARLPPFGPDRRFSYDDSIELCRLMHTMGAWSWDEPRHCLVWSSKRTHELKARAIDAWLRWLDSRGGHD
ncbi:hypothetical protein EFN18_02915 [Propionibacterium freudenreichii]|uniref:hypothetical protein n=1 Tax=Propionibacterium freudenreichii TaxID=1744 RepID=UPI0021A626C1|nr:hypothetical protein [Propionibacterium freudenreichii]MCT2999658.1 hypothetical protein [Propionibacterium freudenreichii]